jgi:hypothetical protein
MKKTLPWLLGSSILVAALSGCGGGGSATSAPPTPNPGAGTDPVTNPVTDPATNPVVNPPITGTTASVINANVSGKLYYEAPGQYVELDIATGVETVMRKSGLGLGASLDGSEFVMTNRFVALLGVGDYREELAILDRYGSVKTRFFRNEGFSGTPHLSPDKTKILSEWSSTDFGDTVNVAVGTVFDRNGNVLKRYPGYSAYAYFADGRILMASGDTLYIASAALGNPVFFKRFIGDRPRGMRISPDGTKIALSLYGNGVDPTSAVNYAHVWIMNADGTGLRQLTTSSSNDDVGDFSPDSQSLIVSQGIAYASIGPGYVFAGCPEAYLISANTTTLANLTADNPAPAQKLRSRDYSGEVSEKLCVFSRPSWRGNTNQTSTTGTTAAGTGRNRGLVGTLWYRFAGDIFKTIVASGETTKLPKQDGADIAVSNDGLEISFYDRFRPVNVSDTALVITNTQANQIGGFLITGDFSGTPKQSPDKTKIAIEWHDIDRGDAGGVSVVTVFSRTGTILQRFVDYNSWAWLPDGRLLLASYDEISVTTAAGATTTSPIKTLPDYVTALVVSRDGSKVAFSMNQNTWMMNIDGTGLKKMNSSDRDFYPSDFSPDGKFLLVQANDSSYEAWAIPVDGERVPVGYGGVVPTGAYRLLQSDGTVVYPSGRVSWRN